MFQTYTVGDVLSATVILRTPSDHVYMAPSVVHKKSAAKKKGEKNNTADALYLLVKRSELDLKADAGSEAVANKYAKDSTHQCKVG